MRTSLAWLVFVCAILPGCVRTTVNLVDDPSDAVLAYDERQSFFLGGVLPSEMHLRASDLCGPKQQLEKVETKFSALDVLLNIVTLEIYSPKTVQGWCR